jgi:hypothetical protein
LIPFISTVEQAREVVAQLDAAMAGPVPPLVFTTAAVDEVRAITTTSLSRQRGSCSSTAATDAVAAAGCQQVFLPTYSRTCRRSRRLPA